MPEEPDSVQGTPSEGAIGEAELAKQRLAQVSGEETPPDPPTRELDEEDKAAVDKVVEEQARK